MICYAVRHGETDWNKEQLLQGWHDIPLNESGLKQAEETRDKLRDVPFAAIYSSPLLRAKKTAEIIAAPHGIPVITDDRLRERHFGKWEGAKWGTFRWSDVWDFDANAECEGESVRTFLDRIFSFFDEISDRHDGPVLIVSHGGTMRGIECYFSGISRDVLHHRILDNGEVQIYEKYLDEPRKIGVCVSVPRIELAAGAGFDYFDLSMKEVMSLSEEETGALVRKCRELCSPVEAFHSMYPGEMRLFGDAENHERVLEYTRRAIHVAECFGARRLAIGSGESRNIPKGSTKEETFERFTSLLQEIAEIAKDSGIVIVPEPLCRAETDFLNTLPEAIALNRRVVRPNVGCMVDFYHFSENGEALQELKSLRPGELRLVHVAGPGRYAPVFKDAEMLKPWADALNETGYRGRISLECRWKDHSPQAYAEARKVLEILE